MISVPDIEKLLHDALANDLELVPFQVLGFYAGVRPTGELRRMQWSHLQLDLSEDQVKLPAGISKTKKHSRWITLRLTQSNGCANISAEVAEITDRL